MARGDDPVGVIPASGAHEAGLTKRELFAAMAMQGMLANSSEDLSGETMGRITGERARWSSTSHRRTSIWFASGARMRASGMARRVRASWLVVTFTLAGL